MSHSTKDVHSNVQNSCVPKNPSVLTKFNITPSEEEYYKVRLFLNIWVLINTLYVLVIGFSFPVSYEALDLYSFVFIYLYIAYGFIFKGIDNMIV